ncbi:hypothetical protein SRHO_G00277710 [Serrasalmus rhombeus]
MHLEENICPRLPVWLVKWGYSNADETKLVTGSYHIPSDDPQGYLLNWIQVLIKLGQHSCGSVLFKPQQLTKQQQTGGE